MKTLRFLCITASALSLAACSDREEGVSGPVAASVRADITTRATVNNTWAVGEDAIGVYATSKGNTNESNVKYVASDQTGSFSPAGEPVYFADSYDARFCAYYPYTDDAEINADGTINWQGGIVKDGKCRWDFLFADGATAGKSSPVVNFSGDHAFRHCMAMVKFTVKAGYGIEYKETLLSFTLDKIQNEGTVNPRNGEMWSYASKTALTGTVNQDLNDSPTVSFILLPQTVQNNSISVSLETSTDDGTHNTYTTTLTAPSGGRFNGGSLYSYTIVVTNMGITIENKGIQQWQEGASSNFNIDA